MKKINEKIRELRTKKDMTQQQVADKLYVTRQAVSRWEQGKSLPDIEMMYKLSDVFEVKINELLDNDSHRELTIDQIHRSERIKRVSWISGFVSLLAITVAIVAILFSKYTSDRLESDLLNQPEEQEIILETITVIVDEIDLTLQSITAHTGGNESIVFDIMVEDDLVVLDNKLEETSWSSLVVGDLVRVDYNVDTFEPYVIEIIDSPVEQSTDGVFVDVFGTTINEYQDVVGYGSRVSSVSATMDQENRVFQIVNNSFTSFEVYEIHNYRELIIDMNVYIDCNNIVNDIVIGTFSYQQIEVLTTITECPSDKMLVVDGETSEDQSSDFMIHSYDVTYSIHIINVPTFTEITVYEYDASMTLIRTTVVDEIVDILGFYAHEDSLSAIVLINELDVDGVSQYVSEQLLIGDSITLNYTSGEGIVFPIDLQFSYNEMQTE